MNYGRGENIEVVIDREGIGGETGIGHLSDDTMVVIFGAGGRVGEAVQATIMATEQMMLGSSVIAYAK